METVSQIGELFVNVSKKKSHHEVRTTIVTYEDNPRTEFDVFKVEGTWVQHVNLTGSVEQLVDVADRAAFMFFTAFLKTEVSLYWEDPDMADFETFNPDQTTTFEFCVIVNDDPSKEDTDE